MASCTGRKRKTSCAVWFGLGASDLIFAAPPFGFLGMGLGIDRTEEFTPLLGGKGQAK